MEVQILSRKLIAPSTLNSHSDDIRNVKISCIDQLAPPSYVQIIFYYENDGEKMTEKLMRLEKSLSETLTIFYPLAGRYDEESYSIKCNNQGVEFLEAQVNGQLSHLFLQEQPDPKLISQFVACYLKHSSTTPLVSVQVNMFECGGLAIGLNISHIVADAHTISLFSNGWARASRSDGKKDEIMARPCFNLASIFPPRDISRFKPPDHMPLRRLANVQNIVTKRFIFDGQAISRHQAYGGNNASRVQVVTALLWRALVRVSRTRYGYARASLMTHAFNIRGKTKLPIAKNSCGNLWRLVLARCEPNHDHESETELQYLVGLVRNSMRIATIESAESSINGDDIFSSVRNAWREVDGTKDFNDEVDVYDFTSWCRMSHYQVDFGWGKPSWVSSSHIPVDGLIIFLDTKNGDGIEAWVNLEKDKMLIFQKDRDIIALTSTMKNK